MAVAPYNSNQTYLPVGGSTPQSTAGAATPFPGTGAAATTPDVSTIPGLPPAPPTSMTWQQFAADNHLSSGDMPTYTDDAGNLNGFASWLINYKTLSQSDRQKLQQEMVNAGLLAANSATGRLSSASNSAVLQLIGLSHQSQSEPLSYLGTSPQGQLGTIQQQLANEVTSANATIAAQPAVAATITNPTSLEAAITNAFDQTLGYAPSQEQKDAFVKAFQDQEVGYQTANQETNRTQAVANLTRAQSEQEALKALGPNDVGTFVSAYAAAIHGTGVPGAATPQGPYVGMSSTALPAGTMGPQGPATPEFSTTTQQPNGRTPFYEANPFAHLGGTHPVTTTTPAVNTPPDANAIPIGLGNNPVHGGIYALSPGLWKAAQAAYPGARKYSTAGEAPQAVQQVAFTALASSLYDQHGNWNDVAVELAGGTPKVVKKSNINDFAHGVAAQVNDNIAALQAQATSQPVVTTRITQPDAGAEANLAAKNADPIGYTAANYSSWAGTLSQMLFGAPSTAINGSADTFTGPVAPPASATTAA